MKQILDWVLGKSLKSSEEHSQRISPTAGIPVLGLDALSSSAYGPEAALTVLLPLGAMGLIYVLPITLAIIALLFIVYISYLQTIGAYPHGGGSYTVAKENLGTFPSLLAAAALMLDYVLVVAVGISAGVGALISALPNLQPYTLSLCLMILVLITLVNLRGVRESSFAFMAPTYAFVFCLFFVLILGAVKTFLANGHPVPIVAPAKLVTASATFTLWLLARAFASGCTAMTGVEAVSNGVTVFYEPVTSNARKSLSYIIFILIFLLIGIAYLANVYHVGATDPGSAGYESMISQLVGAIVGKGIFYYITIASVIAVLALSANTGFADFPRMCEILANDNFLPHIFATRGRRLVFTAGILLIAFLSGVLLIAFGGVTDRLIPLFAIGAFLAFTISQSGMVAHWWKLKGAHTHLPMVVNLLGACATGLTLLVVLVSKFSEGGWITFAVVPILIWLFYWVRRHYMMMAKEIACDRTLNYSEMRSPVAIVPVRGWSALARKALRFSMNLTKDVYAVCVELENSDFNMEEQWKHFVIDPAEGHTPPRLVRISSPYRKIFSSLMDFIDKIAAEYPDRQIVVVVPDLVEHRWYHYFLHNQRAILLKAAIRLRSNPRIIVVDVPWYLQA